MADVRPFRALRPRDHLAARVIAPPYDVLSLEDCHRLATDRLNFVRVTRSEVDLPIGTDAHSKIAYDKARETLDAFVADGTLARDPSPTFYVYGQRMGDHTQVGVIAAASVPEYDDGRIARHEFTRPDKEDDRLSHMETLDAQVGLVFITFPSNEAIRTLIAATTQTKPCWSVCTEDGVDHTLWAANPSSAWEWTAAFAAIPRMYIADGHHRSAAASRLYAKRKDEVSRYFLAGLFPSDRLQVMAYNRVVVDLNGHTPSGFLAALQGAWNIGDGLDEPSGRGEICMYLEGRWYSLRLKAEFRSDHPVKSLDVSALQDRVLGPLLGIDDPRRSKRIEFVGGIHGSAALSRAVDNGAGVAFRFWPTGLDQLFAVADMGEVMPPKSTWFEPKLREGVVIRPLSA